LGIVSPLGKTVFLWVITRREEMLRPKKEIEVEHYFSDIDKALEWASTMPDKEGEA